MVENISEYDEDGRIQELEQRIIQCDRESDCFPDSKDRRILCGRFSATNPSVIEDTEIELEMGVMEMDPDLENIEIMFIGEGPKPNFRARDNYSNHAFIRQMGAAYQRARGECFGRYSTTGRNLYNDILTEVEHNDQPICKISWLTNYIKCADRSLGSRNICVNQKRFIVKEIEMVYPNVIVLLHHKVIPTLGNSSEGKYDPYPWEIGDWKGIVINSFHPSYGLWHAHVEDLGNAIIETLNNDICD